MWARISLAGLVLATIGMPLSAAPTPVQWQTTVEAAKRVAAQNNQLVLIHFWAPFCSYCHRMEAEVLGEPAVAQVLQAGYVAVKVNTEQFPGTARQFGVTKLPTDVIIQPSGQIVQKLEGMIGARDYAARLDQIAAAARPRATQPPMVANIQSNPPSAMPFGAGAPGMTPAPNNGYIANSPYGVPGGVVPGVAAPGGMQPSGAPMGTDPAAPIASPGVNPSVPPFAANNPAPVASAPTNPAIAPFSPPGPSALAGGPQGMPGGAMMPNTPPSMGGAMPSTMSTMPGPTTGSIAPAMNAPGAAPLASQPNATNPYMANAAKPTDTPATATGSAAPPTAADLPPGSPSLVLDGYCPVELQEKRAWVPGDKRYGVIHVGRTYVFAGYDQQQRFFANPDKYAPVLSGMDVVVAVEKSQMVPGDRRFGGYYDNKLYLFSTEDSLRRFDADPARYATAAALQSALPSGTHR